MNLKLGRLAQPSTSFDSAQKKSRRDKVLEFIHYRYMLRNLVIRDLKARYKNSILGIFWSLLNPLLMMTVYTVLFTKLLRGGGVPKYPVFILIGLIPWQFLTASLGSGTNSVVANSSLVKKVYFPRILLPLTSVLSNFVNFLFSLSLIAVMLIIYRIELTIHALWIPAIILTQIIFIFGLVLTLSALHTFYRDVGMILSVFTTAWFFLTPIFYPFEQLQERTELLGFSVDVARLMRWLNPMASIIDGYRTVLWGNVSGGGPGSMDPLNFFRTFITALIILAIGYKVFSSTEHLFGERL